MSRSNQRLVVALISVVGIVVAATIVSLAVEVFFVLFLGGLFGVFLYRVGKSVGKACGISYAWGLAATATALVVTLLGLAVLFGVQASTRLEKIAERADEGLQQVREWAEQNSLAKALLASTPVLSDYFRQDAPASEPTDSKRQSNDQAQANRSTDDESSSRLSENNAIRSTAISGVKAGARFFATTFGVFINALIVFFVGLFLAASPEQYCRGLTRLFPPERRERTRQVLDQTVEALWQWLLGMFGSMGVTGMGAGLLLFALGVPMAATVGVVTALLTFIPNIGSAMALGLAALIALPEGKTVLLLVVVGYVGLQLIESYVVTPLIQQHQVALPPALLIAFQAVMSVSFGFLGTIAAAPLLAAGTVVVEEAYIKDCLERQQGPGKE